MTADLQRGIETFRRQVELISRGEYDAALELHDPDVEIVTRDAEVAITGVWRGREGHRTLLAEWDAAYNAVGIESGVEVSGTFYWLCTYRDGQLVRWETFTDRDQALAAAETPGS